MLQPHNYRNRTGELIDFLNTVENDSSSIVYHTRVFDNFIIDNICGIYDETEIEVNHSISYLDSFEFMYYYQGSTGFFISFYRDFILVIVRDCTDLFSYVSNKLFNNNIQGFFFDFHSVNLEDSHFIFFSGEFATGIQKDESFGFITFSINTFSEIMFHVDFFIIILEILLIAFIFLLLFSKMSNFFVTTKFYDNILNFFKYNNLSFLEVTVTCTLFVSFYVFDIFLSFSEDDSIDTFFYLILIFIVIMFFFLSIAMDIQYFYSMSNTSNGDITIRLLFFDILNNFLSILRIFLC